MIKSEIETLDLSQGKDTYTMYFNFTIKGKEEPHYPIDVTWDEIFSYAGSAMNGECTDLEFKEKIRLVCWHALSEDVREEVKYSNIIIREIQFDEVKVQLQALGLIRKGRKRRAVSDKNVYWDLTPVGEKYLIQVKAIRR